MGRKHAGIYRVTWRLSVKVGDLIREKDFPDDPCACGLIVAVGDLRTKKPYKVFSSYWGKILSFEKQYIQNDCEIVSTAKKISDDD